ncbi:hypothetical protein FOCC_FOCC015214 [Frankliniella occidentalis]|uniref:Uncharacterized protein LOC127751146 n=1 Tax=Frankliniella occidentalis TaxID=133901 RepID=A0A9C6X6L4_FRAOC|nr:uncharacterized protein LOC127751146 [Frankliniella occidentalis]KAE8739291.1 hypothetical protein FOCC_FOCC015214 [Frankliniella occidentalis]
MLAELIQDIGDSWFSLIVDETTDNTTIKHMAVLIKYYSESQGKYIVDFLCILGTPKTTHDVLYNVLVEFMDKVGLRKDRLMALGTDGAANLCGPHHSLFSLLKKDCPNLHLVKCICHGLYKCSSKASAALPGSLEALLRDSRNWFRNSACRKYEYQQEYQALTQYGADPPKLVKIGDTRWLSWHSAVRAHTEQYDFLARHFKSIADKDPQKKMPLAHTLAAYHSDRSHLLYLTFLRPILKEAVQMNTTFQQSLGDFSSVYIDLKKYVNSLAARIIKPQALVQSQPGTMLRLSELQALRLALQRPGVFKELNMIDYGSNFYQTAVSVNLPPERLDAVKKHCADFLYKIHLRASGPSAFLYRSC